MSDKDHKMRAVSESELDNVVGGQGRSDNQIIRWVCPNCSEKHYENWPKGIVPTTLFCCLCNNSFNYDNVDIKRMN